MPGIHSSRIHDWPHSPIHRVSEAGMYMVTAGTYQKAPLFQSTASLSLLTTLLLELAGHHGWKLQAWAVFSNHYHFIGESEKPQGLRNFIRELHSRSAAEINREAGLAGRRVWYQYWDSQLTFQRSYLARLNYVHQNPVRHGLVRLATEYVWCSAAWFKRSADRAFFRTVASFPMDKLDVPDKFDVSLNP